MLRRIMPADNRSGLLAGKRLLVTGGSSGIGRAIAETAAAAGADVALTYRANEAGANEAAAAIRAAGRRAVVVRADLSSESDLDRVAEAAGAGLGGVDAWINNAGADILTGEGARLSRQAKLDRLIAVDLRGTMLASWRAAEIMAAQPDGGTIINMAWDGASNGLAGLNPQLFAAVKGGVESFSRALARSVGPKVRVNTLAPGWIETAYGREAPAAFRDKVTARIPLQRWGRPEDVAGAAIYLASDAARYITGQTLRINGGDVM